MNRLLARFLPLMVTLLGFYIGVVEQREEVGMIITAIAISMVHANCLAIRARGSL